MVERHGSRVKIRSLESGVPGLDAVLGGGLPEFSFSMIAGGPGAGKTTLVQQFIFANATPQKPALYITVLGEPTLKLLRHQQQFSFFDIARVGKDIHFVNLGAAVMNGDLEELLAAIETEVERVRPAFVVVDSFRAIARAARGGGDAVAELEHFVQRLAIQLTTWEITSFLVGEHRDAELDNPVFTVADVIIWLTQAVDHNSVVRKVQVVKVRGQGSMPGLHTFRMSSDGVQVFPRLLDLRPLDEQPRPDTRLSTGIEGLDEMTGGGIPSGDVVLIAGPTGSGKTTVAMQFVNAGLAAGEAAVVAVFEERPREYLLRASGLGGAAFNQALREGRIDVMYLRPLDLSVDETMLELRDTVRRLGATRLVIDSLSGFEVALAPTFRNDFRESLYRLLGMLTSTGVTVMMTNEIVGGPTDQRFTQYQMSFLCDDIILNRFIEIDSEFRRVLTVLKMRRSRHSRGIRAFDITSRGIEIGATLPSYHGIASGMPVYAPRERAKYPGLTAQEVALFELLDHAGDQTEVQLETASGLAEDVLVHALERLIEVGYVARSDRDGEAVYLTLGADPALNRGASAPSPATIDAKEAYGILERMPLGVIVHNERGLIVFANAQAARLVGVATSAELLGRAINAHFEGPFLKGLREGLMQGKQDGSGIRSRVREQLARADGRVLQVELAAVPFLLGGEGQVQLMFYDVAEPRRAPLPGTGERVLVVDDDVLLRRVARRVLERSGHEVTDTGDGPTALALFDQDACFTCVLLDLGLPGMSGEVVLLRMLASRPDVPIVLCSGYLQDERHLADLIGLGRIGFLRKPFGVDELVSELDRMCCPPRPQSATPSM